MMTTEEIALRLVALVREGKESEIWEELYSPEVVSVESMPDSPDVKGIKGLQAKAEKRKEMVEEFHGMVVSDPLVADDFFAVTYTMDITYKGAPRVQETELAVYHVADGKIDKEEYFYDVPSASN